MNRPPALTDSIAQLERIAEDVYWNGIIVYEHKPWNQRKDNPPPWTTLRTNTMVRTYVRRLCRDMKRPFVYVEVWQATLPADNWQAFLTLPSTKAQAVLASPLLVQNPPKAGRWHARPSAPLTLRSTKSRREFIFQGKEGRKRFEDWLEMTRTSEVMRKALKLPQA